MCMHVVLCVVIGLIGSCLGLVQDNFLLVADSGEHGVFQIDLSAGTAWKVPLSNQSNPIAVEYDPLDSKMYWTDVQDKVIKRSNLNGTVEEVVYSLHRESIPDGIAIDTTSRLVYYTDTGLDIIAVMTLDGSHHFTLVTEDMTQPRAIALNPAVGLMYWTDWGDSAKIEVAAMDGTQRRVLISFGKSSWPNGLTIDTAGKRLYWCDGLLNTVESAATDGSDRKVLLTTPKAHFFGIVFVERNLYYTYWNGRHVSKIKVSDLNPTPVRVGPDVFGRPNGIAVYNSAKYARDIHMNSSCSHLNGGCNHICLATPNGPRCACPDKLNFANGTECSSRTYTCPQVYTGNKGQIRSPGYPGYKNNLHCMIIIRMHNTQREHRRILLYVEDFDLQDKYDYLLVGDTKLSGSVLKRYNTYTVSTSLEDVKLLFVTDHSVVGRGFNFVFSVYKVVNCNSDRRCHNGGTCVKGEYCVCRDGYQGDWCGRDTDECASNPCQNGGTCVNKNNAFECRCGGYYRGSVCQYDVNTCRSHPCMNGGSCRSLLDAYHCDCAGGFTGDVCDSHTEGCTSNPCQNGGTCVNKNNAFECRCGGYYRGSVCQYVNLCKTKPCQHGGVCVESGGIRTCNCVGSFSGNSCERSLIGNVSATKKKRINVTIKLKDAEFKDTLKDKDTTEYIMLRNDMEDALKYIIDDKLGKGKYNIVDVTFSAGSLVVTYELEMLKDAPSPSTIEAAIKHHNGTFAGFELDPDAVHTSELSSKEKQTSNKKGVNVTMIGIIVGTLVGLIIVGVAIGETIYCLTKKSRNRAAQQDGQDYSNNDRTNDTYARLQFNNIAYDSSDHVINDNILQHM